MLIAGRAGSGKTILCSSLAEQADKKARWAVVRTSRDTSLDDVHQVLEDAVSEMQRRLDVLAAHDAQPQDQEPVLVVIDEVADRLDVTGEGKASRNRIAEIARMGRAVRYHLVLSVQRPGADVAPAGARDNLGARVALGGLTPEGAHMMFGDAQFAGATPAGAGVARTRRADSVQPLTIQPSTSG